MIKLRLNNWAIIILLFIVVGSCTKKDETEDLVSESRLDSYLLQYAELDRDILIACAASELESNSDFGISVFFYPFPAAHDYSYFESGSTDIDPLDFTQYNRLDIESEAVFNGYLQRFLLLRDVNEKWVILTFFTEDKIHVCDPILLKHNSNPTSYDSAIIQLNQEENGHPEFTWEGDTESETVIYFQVVSDSADNLISGTYTYEKHWKFYDLSNVVLNINEQNPPPVLDIGSSYNFTLMGVSEDNWVNLMGVQEFVAN